MIRQHAHLLWRMLHTVFVRLLHMPDELKRVRLVYMTTIRANSSVACAPEDGCLYFNVLVLQQMQCTELSAGGESSSESATDLARALSPKERERVWRYWLQRAAMVLPRGGATGAWAGLYDPGVRQ